MAEWRVVLGWHGYEVSDGGAIRRGSRLLGMSRSKAGYLVVRLSNGARRGQARVHRIVAEAFIPNPLSKPEINHKDGVKANNAVSNLEWVTSRENRKHAWDTGLRTRAHLRIKRHGTNGRAKLTLTQVEEARTRYQAGAKIRTMAREYGVDKKTLTSALHGKTWKPDPPSVIPERYP